jgi:hypothetical protein
MKPSDLTLLVVLGTADSGPASMEELIRAACMLAPKDWQPTPEAMRRCSEHAVEAGLLRAFPGEGTATGGDALETTPAGRAAIVDLLREPIDASCDGLTVACMSAKLCFLHHLPLAERGEGSESLAHLYQGGIERLRRLDQASIPAPEFARCAIRHEIMRMESELCWLDVMRRDRTEDGRSGDHPPIQNDAS